VIARDENLASLADKSLDELTSEMARLPEGSEQVQLYHEEIVRRQDQADLDKATSELVTERRKYSVLTILILGAGFLAMVASMLFQK
jgi:hypothetical protein